MVRISEIQPCKNVKPRRPNQPNGFSRSAIPISCITPTAIAAINTTVIPSRLPAHFEIIVVPVNARIIKANNIAPKIINNKRIINGFRFTPAPKISKDCVITQTEIGANKVAGRDTPVTKAGSALTKIANAAAELSGGAAEAKVKPVVNQPGAFAATQTPNVIKGKANKTKTHEVERNIGLLRVSINFDGCTLNIETTTVNIDKGTTKGLKKAAVSLDNKPSVKPNIIRTGGFFDANNNMADIYKRLKSPQLPIPKQNF